MLTQKIFTFNVAAENTYLLFNEQRQALLIDPGAYSPEEHNTITQFVRNKGLKVESILLTHAHLDHVCGLKAAAEAFGLKPKMHPSDQPLLENAPISARSWGMPFDPYTGSIDYIDEATLLQLGDEKIEVLHVPGHAPGHLCYYIPGASWLIAGDTLFRESIGRTDFPLCDHELLLQSIRTKLYLLPEETEVFPGHGRSTTIGYEKRNNPFCPALI